LIIHIFFIIYKSEDLTEYKNQAKSIFKKLAKAGTEQRCSIETGQYFFQYVY